MSQLHPGSLKSARAGALTPRKLANSEHQGCHLDPTPHLAQRAGRQIPASTALGIGIKRNHSKISEGHSTSRLARETCKPRGPNCPLQRRFEEMACRSQRWAPRPGVNTQQAPSSPRGTPLQASPLLPSPLPPFSHINLLRTA